MLSREKLQEKVVSTGKRQAVRSYFGLLISLTRLGYFLDNGCVREKANQSNEPHFIMPRKFSLALSITKNIFISENVH